MTARARLVAVKLIHTAVWAFFVAAIAGVPLAAWLASRLFITGLGVMWSVLLGRPEVALDPSVPESFSLLGSWVTHAFFGVPWLLALASLPLIFLLTVICTNSMALTSWTPTGSLAKITHFTMGAIDRSNPAPRRPAGNLKGFWQNVGIWAKHHAVHFFGTF